LIDRSSSVLLPTGAGAIVLKKAKSMMELEKELAQDLGVLLLRWLNIRIVGAN